MPSNDDIQTMFFEECDDLMEALFEGLSLLENDEAEDDTINAIFRSVHSIKGGAGAFKLEALVKFAHRFETVLDELRSDRLQADAPLINVMLRAGDHLASLIEASRDNYEVNDEQSAALLGELDGYIKDDADVDDGFAFEPMTLDFTALDLPPVEAETLHIRFRPYAKLYQNGHDPLLLLEALNQCGDLSVDIEWDALPTPANFDPDNPKLTFLLCFSAENAQSHLDDVFEFVDGICLLEHLENPPLSSPPSGDPSPVEQLGPVVEAAPSLDQKSEAVPPKQDRTSKGPNETAGAAPTLRVELDRVDRLINTVGELIINQAMIAQRIEQLELPSDSELEADMTDYKTLARDLQEGVMAIRAQPVKTLFQRMARITREAGAATGKPVRMIMNGEATEVDKTVIERLADPLTHMIRNAVDHGLEDADTRTEAGKPPTGEISLSASHSSGNVLIEVSDDGGGLNRQRILQNAINKGLVSKDDELTDTEIDKLLFLPGFSTNEDVSELSGRGVGMDVVKRGVEALGGRISISSQAGKGTTFTIVLPLTLAVMDGIVISVADESMIIPITAVVETLRPNPSEVFAQGPDQNLLLIRGEYVPIVSVRDKLGLRDSGEKQRDLVLVLVEGVDQARCALSVDAIHDQRQVVIKAVGGNYGQIPGVSAATIMGNGQIALILDTDHLSKPDAASQILPPTSNSAERIAS